MNKKGFTMVELLAVVALISILSGIATMAVSKYLNKAKKNTYKNYESNLKSAATNYMTNHSDITNITLDSTKLINEGYLEEMTDPNKKSSKCTGTVIIKGTYDNPGISYNLTFDYKVCLKCSNYKSSSCSN